MAGVAHCVPCLNYFHNVFYTEYPFSFREAGNFVHATKKKNLKQITISVIRF